MSSSVISESQPDPFFTVRVKNQTKSPTLTGLCVGYERGEWRASELADHVMEWLPEFALNFTERKSLGHQNSVKLLKRAAAAVYATDKFSRRGEFGELLLHAAVRQVFNSVPAISKLFYKTARNDTVKGFDAVHVVGPANDLELWLGEVKFYSNIKKAMTDVVKELQLHTGTSFLKGEFAVITNMLDKAWPHAEALRALLRPNVSLDAVFSRMCIPVMLTYDSPCIAGNIVCDNKYITDFTSELDSHHAAFAGMALPKDIRIHLFLLPLKKKDAIVTLMDKKLKQWQNL
jgi:hypothetical protein